MALDPAPLNGESSPAPTVAPAGRSELALYAESLTKEPSPELALAFAEDPELALDRELLK